MDKEKVISYLRVECDKLEEKAFQSKSQQDVAKFMNFGNALLIINEIL